MVQRCYVRRGLHVNDALPSVDRDRHEGGLDPTAESIGVVDTRYSQRRLTGTATLVQRVEGMEA